MDTIFAFLKLNPTWLCYFSTFDLLIIYLRLLHSVMFCSQFDIDILIALENKLKGFHLSQCPEAFCLIRGLSVA